MRQVLLFALMIFCTFSKAQSNTELKDFINKNNVAIRTVQKNMIREGNSSYVASFKSILKNQEAAIKLYNTDKKASCYFAFLARTESLGFLKTHTKGSTEYFDITDAEKLYSKSSADLAKTLSESEIKTVEDMDAMSSQSLNNLTLTIQ